MAEGTCFPYAAGIDPAIVAAVYTDFHYNSEYLNTLVAAQLGTAQFEERLLTRALTIQTFMNSPSIPIGTSLASSTADVEQCAQKCVVKAPRTHAGVWSAEETEFLANAIIERKLGFTCATTELNARFGTARRPNEVHQRWTRVQNPSIRKGRWTRAEDRVLRTAATKHAANAILEAAVAALPQRTRLEIRNRCNRLGIDV